MLIDRPPPSQLEEPTQRSVIASDCPLPPPLEEPVQSSSVSERGKRVLTWRISADALFTTGHHALPQGRSTLAVIAREKARTYSHPNRYSGKSSHRRTIK
ncbi:hypothetical protein RR48_00614 [Papilio machaon]|uniref:Uncharacterized protein n=1 Tax=Papilio machaon TaxID=76193 RepID=A0A0N1IIW2_PAPMA|nr:hypothetical protein RR48_00614 [Papilio machaon]